MKSCHPRETGNIGYTRRRQTKQKHRETGNIGYTRRRQTKQTHNTIGIGHHYLGKKATNNVNKTWALLQTTGVKDEPNIVFMRKTARFFIHSP